MAGHIWRIAFASESSQSICQRNSFWRWILNRTNVFMFSFEMIVTFVFDKRLHLVGFGVAHVAFHSFSCGLFGDKLHFDESSFLEKKVLEFGLWTVFKAFSNRVGGWTACTASIRTICRMFHWKSFVFLGHCFVWTGVGSDVTCHDPAIESTVTFWIWTSPNCSDSNFNRQANESTVLQSPNRIFEV